MIKVNIKRKNNIIKEIKLTGHAKYDEYGKDIVCAGVSTSLTVTINACLSFDKKSITYNESDPFILTNINEVDLKNKLLILLRVESQEREAYLLNNKNSDFKKCNSLIYAFNSKAVISLLSSNSPFIFSYISLPSKLLLITTSSFFWNLDLEKSRGMLNILVEIFLK